MNYILIAEITVALKVSLGHTSTTSGTGVFLTCASWNTPNFRKLVVHFEPKVVSRYFHTDYMTLYLSAQITVAQLRSFIKGVSDIWVLLKVRGCANEFYNKDRFWKI